MMGTACRTKRYVLMSRCHSRRKRVATILSGFALLAAACSTTAQSKGVSSQYLRIAGAGNDRLEKDIDGLTGRDQDHLAAARADLRDASSTEQLFDRRLRAISFPPMIAAIAKNLYTTNQSRARLSATAATSSTFTMLRAYEVQIANANAKVEQQVRGIRKALHLPPPDTS